MVECTFQSEAWRSEFERQSSGDLYERLHRAARARLRMYAGRTKHVNDADVDDAVMSVITDTLDGTLTWNPDTKPLERHLLDTIAYRVRDHARFKRRHPEEAYEEDTTGEAISPCMLGDVGTDLDLRMIADQIVPEIQERAGDDAEVLLLLELFGDGLAERGEVMSDARMVPTQYDNAMRRLRRLTRQLPKQTREAVMAALT
jgi:hypothetical protein